MNQGLSCLAVLGPRWALTQALLADFPGDPLVPAAAACAPLTLLNLAGPSPSQETALQAPSCRCWPTPDLLACASQARPGLCLQFTCVDRCPREWRGKRDRQGGEAAQVVTVISDPEMLLILWRTWRLSGFPPCQMQNSAAQ